MAGLSGAEDMFSSVWDSARNRSPWLLVNLITAFVATRFIGVFETTIQGFVSLATLMPIVASIGGNTGNQTVALVIRGLAFEQFTPDSRRHLLRKELIVSLLNGILWGSLAGITAGLFYRRAALGIVMMAAIILNLTDCRRSRRARAADAASHGTRPGAGLERPADIRNRLDGLLPISLPCLAVPCERVTFAESRYRYSFPPARTVENCAVCEYEPSLVVTVCCD